MPNITINGVECEFTEGQMILEVAKAHGIDIPHYCYHEGLSIAASCRICLGEALAPNPRNEGKLEPFMGGKLFPTCQTPAAEGWVVNTDSPKAIANQKAVMEYLLINHPLDCPVCDQAGECSLQDYSQQYGRGESRFEESKVKQPKKDVGDRILLYSDRCIMCTRCVRFTREISGTCELYIDGRGNKNEIDVFPGVGLNNPIAGNVIDLCPVGALLDKDFLFTQRVWFLKKTPSIDGITASGDNIWIEHNQGGVYRIKPRENPKVNKWWISDEVRYGWKHVHAENRLRSPMTREHGALVEADYSRAYQDAIAGLKAAAAAGKRVALLVSPNLTCEEAYALGTLAKLIDPQAIFGLGPVPMAGEDQTFPPGASEDKAFKVYAEKAPNARGVQRVLGAIGQMVLDAEAFFARVKQDDIGAILATGNYREDWASSEVLNAIKRAPRASEGTSGALDKFVVLIDTHGTALIDHADVVIPGATWAEKAGTFESARKILQAFEQAIPVIELAKTEGQIALDLIAEFHGEGNTEAAAHRARVVIVDEQPGQVPMAVEVAAPLSRLFEATAMRTEMADRYPGLGAFVSEVVVPEVETPHVEGVEMVEL